MDRKELISEIKKILKLRYYIPNKEFEEECKKQYISWLEQYKERWTYDWNIFIWSCYADYPYKWASDIEQAIWEAKEKVIELEDTWLYNVYWEVWYWHIRVYWMELLSFDDFYKKRCNTIVSQTIRSPQYNICEFLAKTLWINRSQIRYIYIKLLLEEKITIEDFVNLCSSRNYDIDLDIYIEKDEWKNNN